MGTKVEVSTEAVELASNLARSIAVAISEERASKFGYDMMKGIVSGNFVKRLKAWIDWYNNHMQGDTSSVDEERDGVWVPAIPYTPDNESRLTDVEPDTTASQPVNPESGAG